MKERYEKIKSFALQLNRYARRKGVALQFSSSSWGVDYYSWGVPYSPWILNRESYPDGPVYSCMGALPWFEPGATGGGCLANDALTDRIVKRQRQLVQDVEPASIYLHNVDYADYASLAKQWKGRCSRCRERFPDDEPYSPRGYAAAVAALVQPHRRGTQEAYATRQAAMMPQGTWKSSSLRRATLSARKMMPSGRRGSNTFLRSDGN